MVLPQAVPGLGSGRTVDWLCGAREIDELAVRPGDRDIGLAVGLLPRKRPPRTRPRTVRQGWTQATHFSPTAKASPPS
ncbi:MAG: hypothetical protein HOY79_25135 [Streptomyces sp.]|nr:hypothetical protein [Streptomyces sp.]